MNPNELRLKLIKPGMNEDERREIESVILQIEARKKYGTKFRHLLSLAPDFIFPDLLACEQASNDLLALYHSLILKDLISGLSDKSNNPEISCLIDMTAGLGVDFIFMSRTLNAYSNRDSRNINCLAIELDPLRADTLKKNIAAIPDMHANVINADSIEVLKTFDEAGECAVESEVCPGNSADRVIFVDPARRGSNNSRLYDPADCVPDIIGNCDLLFHIADTIMIKNSPMLDIDRVMKIFKNVAEIHIVSVNNECKEVLAVCRKDTAVPGADSESHPVIKCVNIIDDKPETFDIQYNPYTKIRYLPPSQLSAGMYLYEPNPSIMKAGMRGALSLITRYHSLQKLSPNCNLYISREHIYDFPGRCLLVDSILDKKSAKGLKGTKVNVATRNYPLKPEQLAAKLKVKSSPDNSAFIYGLTVGPDEIPHLLSLKI